MRNPAPKRRPVAATICSIALILAMLAFLPGMVIFTGATIVCLATPVVALVCFRATPRLAIATLYWSAATILASPMLVNLPLWQIGCIALGGLALLVALLVHYRKA